jgi:hypothetical protein
MRVRSLVQGLSGTRSVLQILCITISCAPANGSSSCRARPDIVSASRTFLFEEGILLFRAYRTTLLNQLFNTIFAVSSLLGIFQLLNEHIVQSYPSAHIPNAQRVPLPSPPAHGAFPARGPIGGYHRPHQSFQGGRGPPQPGLHGPPPVTDAIPRHVAAHKSLPWPVLLAIVGQLEVLAETAAQEYRGEEKKWGVVALLEGLK